MNPELVRNAWLELTPTRRWATPAVLALLLVPIFVQAMAHGGAWLSEALTFTGVILFGMFTIMGAMKTLMCVSNEIMGSTWDQQRLSQHHPWEFLLGKLFGSTVFEWYGGVLALGIFVLGQMAVVPVTTLVLTLATLVGGALWMQAAGLFVSLSGAHAVRTTRRPGRNGMGTAGSAVVAVALTFTISTPVVDLLRENGASGIVHWWLPMPMSLFAPLSIAMFLAWTVAGAHRLIRAELQEPVTPWPWLAFLGFLTLYLFPLTTGAVLDQVVNPLLVFAGTGALVFGSMVPMLALGERKDVVRLRTLAAAWVRRDRVAVQTLTPLWVYTLAGFGLWTVALGVLALVFWTPAAWMSFTLALAFFLLFVRDIGVLLAVHLAPRPGREPGLAAMFYLAALYVLAPILIACMGTTFQPGLLVFLPFLAAFPDTAWGIFNFVGVLLTLPTVVGPWVFAVPRIRRALRPVED